jgi:hypothetical protein|tara:strand:+ start:334 stop:792 length:459 start_codon:yes stop_codon:yes gene_type:complete
VNALRMSSETLQTLGIILLLNAVAWGGYVALQDDRETPAASANVTVSLDFGDAGANATTFANATTVSFAGIVVTNDTSAYAATIAAARANGFAVGVTMYSFGPYVHTLDGVAGDSGHYWELNHNGAYSMVGAGDLQLHDGDTIAWKYVVADW